MLPVVLKAELEVLPRIILHRGTHGGLHRLPIPELQTTDMKCSPCKCGLGLVYFSISSLPHGHIMAEAAALVVRSLTKTHPHFRVADMALLDVGDRIAFDSGFYAF